MLTLTVGIWPKLERYQPDYVEDVQHGMKQYMYTGYSFLRSSELFNLRCKNGGVDIGH